MMGVMPNAPKTPHRTIRVPDDVWTAAQQRAKAEGRNLSELIREWLTDYAKDSEDNLGL